MDAEDKYSVVVSENSETKIDTFDTDAFIKEIRKHPCIWNYKCDLYSVRSERNSAWNEICEKFAVNFSEKSSKEKEEIEKTMQRKWKTLRDGFSRYLQKRKKQNHSPGSAQTRQYLYFRQLSFLMSLAADKDDSNRSVKNEYSSDNNNHNNESSVRSWAASTPLMPPKRRKVTSLPAEDSVVEATTSRQAERRTRPWNINLEQDEDKLFLLSLSGEFKKISEEYRLDAKSEIIAVFKKFKALSAHAQHQSIYPQLYKRVYTSSSSSSQSLD